MFVDSDDFLMPDAIEIMLGNIIKMDSDLLVADYMKIKGSVKESSHCNMKVCENVAYSQIHGYL